MRKKLAQRSKRSLEFAASKFRSSARAVLGVSHAVVGRPWWRFGSTKLKLSTTNTATSEAREPLEEIRPRFERDRRIGRTRPIFAFASIFFCVQLFAPGESKARGDPAPPPQGPPETCVDDELIYKTCSDQGGLVRKALAEEDKAGGKLLLFKFGADWCAWCKSLHGIFTDAKFQQDFPNLRLVEIGLYKGPAQFPNGRDALTLLMSETRGSLPEKWGMPLLVIVNPRTKQAITQQTDSLEQNTRERKGHNRELVEKTLRDHTESLNRASP